MLIFLAAGVALADPELAEFASLAPGTYSSAAQHAGDARYDEVEAEITRIWPERSDGVWTYQEQAILNRDGVSRADAKAKPYFQRVTHLYRLPDGSMRRDSYTLKDPARFVGKPHDVTPGALGDKGCFHRVERIAKGYWTQRTESCANGWRGAVSMTSNGVQTPTGFANWDRGWSADSKQVWGPVAGGYIFVRK
jgi:hypothetical protein